jgi:hypothetical protein
MTMSRRIGNLRTHGHAAALYRSGHAPPRARSAIGTGRHLHCRRTLMCGPANAVRRLRAANRADGSRHGRHPVDIVARQRKPSSPISMYSQRERPAWGAGASADGRTAPGVRTGLSVPPRQLFVAVPIRGDQQAGIREYRLGYRHVRCRYGHDAPRHACRSRPRSVASPGCCSRVRPAGRHRHRADRRAHGTAGVGSRAGTRTQRPRFDLRSRRTSVASDLRRRRCSSPLHSPERRLHQRGRRGGHATWAASGAAICTCS